MENLQALTLDKISQNLFCMGHLGAYCCIDPVGCIRYDDAKDSK